MISRRAERFGGFSLRVHRFREAGTQLLTAKAAKFAKKNRSALTLGVLGELGGENLIPRCAGMNGLA